jgi:cytochrome b pre-mRNA-processing protein 3
MGFIARLFGLERSNAAQTAYIALVEAARSPVLFQRLAVRDDVDGRFDMIALTLGLTLDRLDRLGPGALPLAVALKECFVDDMDRSVREMGVGDLSVGKHVQRMAQALEGRRQAYGEALAQGDMAALQDALLRNLYRGAAPPADALAHAVALCRGWQSRLAGCDAAVIANLTQPLGLEALLP